VIAAGNDINSADETYVTGQQAAMTIGRDGLPLISYSFRVRGDVLQPSYLAVGHCVNMECQGVTTAVVATGGMNSVEPWQNTITIGADGQPIIAFWESTNQNLAALHCSDLACANATTTSLIDEFDNVGDRPSITEGADGLPVISYHSVTDRSLKIARCPNAACDTSSGSGFVVPF
jgi:hypothetical protein